MSIRKQVFPAIICAAMLIPAISASRSNAASKPQGPLNLTIMFKSPDTCRVSVNDQFFLMPEQESGLLESLKLLAKNDRAVSIIGEMAVPYRCIGHIIYTVQRAGFKNVSFTAEPLQTK